VNPIRPAGYPIQPPANPAADSARLAAQRAFFDQALGRAGGPAPTQAAAAPQAVAAASPVAAQPVRPVAAPQDSEGPAKLPRPGSLLDIRV
jgi:hypothetical protein